jgi:transposase
MSQAELGRLEVIKGAVEKRLKQREAAELLGVSVRQVKRMVKGYRREGAEALVSKQRGRASNNRVSAEVKAKAVELLRSRYGDFGPTLASEKLLTAHKVRLSVESVRKLMVEEGLWKPKVAKKPVIHPMRERRSRVGELIQIDGSPHDWFEGRAPKCTLLVMIDDATSRLMQLRFAQAETTFSYFAALRGYIADHGKPLALYSDKYGVFRVNAKEAISGTGETQFGRAMKELKIELIWAHSPQAKGRVERVNQTLQDRMVKEMRLEGVSGMEEGNLFIRKYVPEFNSRFGVQPRSEENAHRQLLETEELDRILCLMESRVLSKNLTISYKNKIYQIETERASYTMRGAHVDVRESEDGAIKIEYKGTEMKYSEGAGDRNRSRQRTPRPVPVTPAKMLDERVSEANVKRVAAEKHHPAPDHPWRRFRFFEEKPARGPRAKR